MSENHEPASSAGTAGILPRSDGATIAYNRLAGKKPGIVFLHGYKSDMTGGKATALEAFCRDRGQAFLRFDCTGHGQSSGRLEDGTIGQWAADAVTVIDELTEGPQVLVGSSMGGWLMLLAALQRPERVAGLVGLAAAPDFSEELIFDAFSREDKDRLLKEGVVYIDDPNSPAPYPVTRRFIEDGRQQLLLHGPINLTCPVRLIHGQEDLDVPWRTALRLAGHLASTDVEVTLVKSAGHRLSEPADLDRMFDVVERLLRQVEGK